MVVFNHKNFKRLEGGEESYKRVLLCYNNLALESENLALERENPDLPGVFTKKKPLNLKSLN